VTTTAEMIAERTQRLLTEDNGLLFGQCVTAVGWVGGSIPPLSEGDGIVELSMADVAGASIAVGAALSGRRCIYVIRYQGFLWYNAASLVNYAAKSKFMWEIPCPIMVRSISMDGSIGPVASGSHHGMVGRMPGLAIAAPITPGEWSDVFDWWMEHDDPIYVSESRKSFTVDYELSDGSHPVPDVTLIGIGASRLNMAEVQSNLEKQGLTVNIFHQVWLKPFVASSRLLESVVASRVCLIVDSDFEDCSIAKTIAFELMHASRKQVHVLGLEERAAGFSAASDNTTPSGHKIFQKVNSLLQVKECENDGD